MIANGAASAGREFVGERLEAPGELLGEPIFLGGCPEPGRVLVLVIAAYMLLCRPASPSLQLLK
jgi:hypothetical protein